MKKNQEVMINIDPKQCDRIAHGKQTAIALYTRPVINPPFKCYIYQKDTGDYVSEFGITNEDRNGMVIGECICDSVHYLGNVAFDNWRYLAGDKHEYHKSLVTKRACMTEEEIRSSSSRYVMCISKFVLYGAPKSACDFYNYRSGLPLKKEPIVWCYVNK